MKKLSADGKRKLVQARVPISVHVKLTQLAERENRSLANFIDNVLTAYVENHRG